MIQRFNVGVTLVYVRIGGTNFSRKECCVQLRDHQSRKNGSVLWMTLCGQLNAQPREPFPSVTEMWSTLYGKRRPFTLFIYLFRL